MVPTGAWALVPGGWLCSIAGAFPAITGGAFVLRTPPCALGGFVVVLFAGRGGGIVV